MFANPIIKSLRNINYYLIFWSIIATISVILLYIGTDIGLYPSLADGFIFSFVLGALGLAFWYPARYIPIEKYSTSKIVIGHAVGAVITTAIWISIAYFLMVSVLGFKNNYPSFLYGTLSWRILIGLLFYALFVSFYYMIIYYTGFQERTVKEAELKSLVTEAELKSLKFQINPHFVFNSLNSMSALTEIDPARARQMIIKLADFLRFILKTNELEKNKLKEELANIRLYLDIEHVRFEDKFEYIEEIGEGCSNIEIPTMILQPLFENAIKHAVYETLEKVTLTLKCELKDGFLKIVLENNFDKMVPQRKGAGVGIKNIRERLKLIYQQDSLLDVKEVKGNFIVTLYIPVPDYED